MQKAKVTAKVKCNYLVILRSGHENRNVDQNESGALNKKPNTELDRFNCFASLMRVDCLPARRYKMKSCPIFLFFFLWLASNGQTLTCLHEMKLYEWLASERLSSRAYVLFTTVNYIVDARLYKIRNMFH